MGASRSEGLDGASPPSTGRSLSPEERQREKERLQEMVKEFTKQVVQGQPCHLIDNKMRSTPVPAVYSIDRYLKTFRLQIGSPPGSGQEESVEMASIGDVV